MSPSPELGDIRILADEDVSFKLIRPLRALGADITTATKGLKNGKLFKKAIKDSRILLTHDSDFADPFLYPVSKSHGVLIMRIHPPVEADLLDALRKFFRNVSPDSVRGKRVFLFKTGYEII